MENRFLRYCFKFFFTQMLFWTLFLSNAQALSISGDITCPGFDPGSEGLIYIGVFDAEDADPENMVGSTQLAAPGAYTIDLGDAPPENVIVVAFYDANNSSVHGDTVLDWPELGDVLGGHAGLVAIGTTDIIAIDIDIATIYAGTGAYQLYDDFTNASGLFDADKWSSLEQIRRVRNGTFFSGIRSSNRYERNAARINTTEPVIQFKVDVMVESISDGLDGWNAVSASIETMLYNTASATPDDAGGDLQAGLYLVKLNGNFGFSGIIQQSMNSQGNEWQWIFNESIVIPGGAQENTWYQLEILYDPSADSVTFNVYDAGGVLLNTAVAENLPSFKGPAYLFSGPELITGITTFDDSPGLCHVFAQFDNVYLNGGLHDNFSGTALDPLRWGANEIVKVMENNSAVFMADSRGATETVRLQTPIFFAHMAVDVKIDSASLISVGSKGRFRLEGNFYNDELGYGSGREYDGEKGDVWAQIYIDRTYNEAGDDYSMRAGYSMGKALVPQVADYGDHEQWADFAFGTFDAFPIDADKPYRLSINITGRQMIYTITDLTNSDTQTLIYEIPGPAYDANDPYRGVTSRVYAYSGAGGTMMARCDQLLVGGVVDSDTDTLSNFDEIRMLFNPLDGDMDGDGIMDGNEDKNINGRVDFNETDPKNPDTDQDGVKDGTEIGLTTAQLPAYADSDFIPDYDPATTTNPADPDTDRDSLLDGEEDSNQNGRVDLDIGESDPNKGVTVSGRVTDSLENPIIGLWVHAFDNGCGGTWLGGARTDSNGNYTMIEMPPGDVYVEACSRCDEFMFTNEWWTGTENPGSVECNDAQNLNVQPDEDRSGIDFELESAGGVSGIVKDKDGNLLQGIHVYAQSAGCSGIWLSGADTDEKGKYTITGIPEGDSIIRACPDCNGKNYVGEYYDGSDGTLDCSDATPLTVELNQVISDIDFDLAAAGSVSGTITDSNDDPIPGVHVQVKSASCGNSFQYSQANTDSNGQYVINSLPEGPVYVYACPECNDQNYVGEWFDNVNKTQDCNDAVRVEIVVQQESGNINFQLETGYMVSGKVLDDSGNPVPGIWVQVNDEQAGVYLGGANTDDTGNYSIIGLPAPSSEYYRVYLNSGETYYVDEEYSDPITPGQTNINFTPQKGGKIVGNVSGDGQDLFNVCVNAHGINCGNHINGRGTDENGYYSFTVPAGTYAVNADPNCNPDLNFIREYWTAAGGELDCANADNVVVIVGEDTQKNFDLSPGGSVSGSIWDEQDRPIENLYVYVADFVTNAWMNGVNTAADGSYTIDGLPAGTYRINACPSCDQKNYRDEFYDETYDWDLATSVKVTAEADTPDIDFRLAKDVNRIAWGEVAVYNGELSSAFDVHPGFAHLVKSAGLSGPNGFTYAFDIQNDILEWLNECSYLVCWAHDFTDVFDYGTYTLTVAFKDGASESYTQTIVPISLAAVESGTMNHTVNPDGSIDFSWINPDTTKRYQVRVYQGGDRYYRSGMFTGNSLSVSAEDLRCLVPGEAYTWQVRAFDMNDPYSACRKSESVQLTYDPSALENRAKWFEAAKSQGTGPSPEDKIALYFNTRPGSRNNVISARVAGPDDFIPYEFDLDRDWFDMSTESRRLNGWSGFYNPGSILDGEYTLMLAFGGGYSETHTYTLSSVVLTPVAEGTMSSRIYENGAMHFFWTLPEGVNGQKYRVRIRSLDGSKEFFVSGTIPDLTDLYASFWDLRGLVHGQTYKWFVRAYDSDSDTSINSPGHFFTYDPFHIYPYITGDMDNDGVVDGRDLAMFAGQLASQTAEITLEAFAAGFGWNE